MITQEKVRELFDYRDGKLYWRESRVNNQIKAGTRAGCKCCGKPYWQIGIESSQYREHRIIFLMFNRWLPKEVDHISDLLTNEGIKSNHIENLQPLSNSENQQKKPSIKGSSKYKGVYWFRKTRKWHSSANYKYHKIHFGFYDDEESAARDYDKFVIANYGEHCFTNFPKSDYVEMKDER